MVHAENAKRETRENLKFMKENKNRMNKVSLKQIKNFVKVQDFDIKNHNYLLDSRENLQKLHLSEDWNRQNQDNQRSKQFNRNMSSHKNQNLYQSTILPHEQLKQQTQENIVDTNIEIANLTYIDREQHKSELIKNIYKG